MSAIYRPSSKLKTFLFGQLAILPPLPPVVHYVGSPCPTFRRLGTLDIAPLYKATPSQKRWGMAHVVRDLTVLPATHAFIRERCEPCLCLPSRSWSSFYRPRRDGRLSRPSWRVTFIVPRWFTRPKTVTHPTTYRARRWLTSLIRPTSLTIRPRRQQIDAVCNVSSAEDHLVLSTRYHFWLPLWWFVVAVLLLSVTYCIAKFDIINSCKIRITLIWVLFTV